MKTITLPLGYFVLIATFLILYPFDSAHAFRDQERDFIYEERKDTLVRLVRKNYRGRRKGFIFGLGVGVGSTSFTKPLAEYYWRHAYESEWSTERQTRSALVTELKIGHGLSDQFLLYYTSRISWLPLQHFYKDTMVANGAAGMGFMYFPFRRIGLYLVGNIGLATLVTWQPPLTLENARQTGVSVSGGIGYEFLSHWSIDFTVNSGNAKTTRVDDPSEIIFNDEILTFSVNLNMLAY
ncbi:MAG: hypothetical protein OXH00_17485 [Candidatus Poribacteria bacterium]|nr:hypothetical protein [Candidatus Poribacteria bacterium]